MTTLPAPERVQSGPFLADDGGVYTRQQGIEQWLLVGILVVGCTALLVAPLGVGERLDGLLALLAGGGIGSMLSAWWRHRRPLPLVLLREGQLLCFKPGLVPRLLARFPVGTVASVALFPEATGLQLEWLFRGGEQARFTLCPDLRLGQPLAYFLNASFGSRFKDRRA